MQRQNQIAWRAPHYASPARTAAPAKPAPAPAKPAATPEAFPVPDNTMFMLGFRQAAAAFNRRNLATIDDFVRDANSTDPLLRRNGLSALLGAGLSLCDIVEQSAAKGAIRLVGTLPTRAEIEYAFRTNPARFNTLLQIVSRAANDLMDAAPALTVASQSTAERGEKGPVQIEVVAMPARETAIKVKRDERGDITGSVQFEQDVAK